MGAELPRLSEFPPEMVNAVKSHAEFTAVAVATIIHRNIPDRRAECSAAFLLEIGAVATIEAWEADGLDQFLPANLPSSR